MYNDLEKVVENLNKEITNLKFSKEYQFGYKYEFLKRKLKKMQFIDIFNALRFALLPKVRHDINLKLNYVKNDTSKIVVYTCITGNYDNIYDPLYKKKNIDYVLFSNNEIKSNVWKVKPIPKKLLQENNMMINRYFKMHPHEMFKDYDYSIYIDGNILVVGDISEFISTINNKTGISVHKHSDRECIYDESKACIWNKKGDIKKLKNQIIKYKNCKFPKKYGLAEMNVIVVNLKSKSSFKLMNSWWEEFVKSGSKRDQISFPFVLWENGYKMEDLGLLGNNVYKNPKLQIYKHVDR